MHGAVVGIKNGVAGSTKNVSRGVEGDERDTLQKAVDGACDIMAGMKDGVRDMLFDAEGKAVLFTAQSGVGKTTHLRL